MAKEEVILEFKVDASDAISEAEKLKKTIIGLKQDQQDLNKKFKEGEVTLDEYASESVRLEQVLKKTSKAYSDVSHQIQGTKSFTAQLNNTLKTLSPSLSSTIDGLKGMTTAALKFIATPIGAIIAAVVLAIASLVSYFKRTEEGGDSLAKKMDQLSAVFNVIMDRVAALGGALVKLFTGDFSGAAETAKAAFTGIADEIKREYEEAGRLAEILDKLEDRERNYSVAASETTLKIKELRAEAKNRKLDEEEKIKILNQAFELEKKQNQELLGIKSKGLEAEIAKIQMTEEGAKMVKQAGESQIEFAKRLVENEKIQGDARDDLAKKIIEYNEVQGQSLVIQEQINNSIDANIEKQNQQIEKIAEQLSIKQLEQEFDRIRLEEELEAFAAREMAKIQQESIDISIAEGEVERQEASANTEDIISRKKQANLLAIHKMRVDLMKQGLSEEQANAKIHQAIENQKLAMTADALGAASSLFKQNTVAYKVTATTQAIISTYLAAAKGVEAAGGNPILAAIFAAANIALGLLQVGKITGVAAAGGAKFTTKGPTLLLVGDNPGGRERVEVTPVSGRGVTRTFGRNGIAMAGGGSVDGSILAAASTRNIDTQFDLRSTFENIPPIKLSLTELREENERIQFKEEITSS